jgi:hypothetical protein
VSQHAAQSLCCHYFILVVVLNGATACGVGWTSLVSTAVLPALLAASCACNDCCSLASDVTSAASVGSSNTYTDIHVVKYMACAHASHLQRQTWKPWPLSQPHTMPSCSCR